MSKKIENFEWTSLIDLTGKGLSQYNAVGQNLNCSQLMRNAGLDFTVSLEPVAFTNTSGQKIVDKKLKSLVKDNKERKICQRNILSLTTQTPTVK